MFSMELESRFVTLFQEAAALTQCTKWLSGLYSRSIDKDDPGRERAKRALNAARRVLDDLLPGTVGIKRIDTERVYFHGVGGAEVAVLELSDGYRSFLSLAIYVLRQLEASSDDLSASIEEEDGQLRVVAEGVILIDEVDVHLHPL